MSRKDIVPAETSTQTQGIVELSKTDGLAYVSVKVRTSSTTSLR